MTAAGNIQSNQKKGGSAEGSIGYGQRPGAYARAEAVEKLAEDQPPGKVAADPAAEAANNDAGARAGYDFEQKRKSTGRKSGAYGQAESLETMVEDPQPKAAGSTPVKEAEGDAAARAGYDFEPKRKSNDRNIGHRPGYRGGNRKKKSGSEESYVGYVEGFHAQGQADFAESWMGDLPLEAAIDAMAREELEIHPRARRNYQFEQRRQVYTLPGHRNLRVNTNMAEKHLPRYTPEEFVAMGLAKSVDDFPFKLESDGRLSKVRFLVYMSAKQIYDENRGKVKGMKPGFLTEAAKAAGTFAYTELSNPLNAIGGAVGGQVSGRLLKKMAVGGASAGGMDFAAGLAGKTQAERWGAKVTMGDVVGSALVSVGMGAGFTMLGEAAKGLVKRASRSWNDWRSGRKQSGSDEMGPAYGSNQAMDQSKLVSGEQLDSLSGNGNNNSQIVHESPARSASETEPVKYSISVEEPLDRVDFVSNRDGRLELVGRSGSGARHSINLNNAQDQELLRHIGREELAKAIQSTHGLGRTTKNELAELNARSRKNKVVAHCEVDGLDDLVKGYNPAANAEGHIRGKKGEPLFFKRNSKNERNIDIYTADAEIITLQRMYERFPNGELKGKNARLSVSGKDVCRECLQDIPAAADALGLNSIMIYQESSGVWLYWHKGMPANSMAVLGK